MTDSIEVTRVRMALKKTYNQAARSVGNAIPVYTLGARAVCSDVLGALDHEGYYYLARLQGGEKVAVLYKGNRSDFYSVSQGTGIDKIFEAVEFACAQDLVRHKSEICLISPIHVRYAGQDNVEALWIRQPDGGNDFVTFSRRQEPRIERRFIDNISATTHRRRVDENIVVSIK